MDDDAVQAYFIDRTVVLTQEELLARSGITGAELEALVDSGALAPRSFAAAAQWTFTVECLGVARNACRLREELALDDTHALAVVLRLAQRVAELQGELTAMHARRGNH